jgi:orotidine-5'-phosphate decarboxylase
VIGQSSSAKTNPLIIALDVESRDEASKIVRYLGDSVDFYKVGMELYAAAGMDFVRQLVGHRKKVFLDLKLYDIGETVRRTVVQVARSGATFLTVHGERGIMKAAREGRGDAPLKLLAVTVLTSLDQDDLKDLGYICSIQELVSLRVQKALDSDMDGVVCSPLEVASVREIAGPKMLLVTPGVRSSGNHAGDQKRVATPQDAMRNGADYLVVGRQVTRAENPRKEVERILQEVSLP